jgi:hypothetical protein
MTNKSRPDQRDFGLERHATLEVYIELRNEKE